MIIYMRFEWKPGRPFPKWCRFANAGGATHVMVCRLRIPATEAVWVSRDPPQEERCTACLAIVPEGV